MQICIHYIVQSLQSIVRSLQSRILCKAYILFVVPRNNNHNHHHPTFAASHSGVSPSCLCCILLFFLLKYGENWERALKMNFKKKNRLTLTDWSPPYLWWHLHKCVDKYGNLNFRKQSRKARIASHNQKTACSLFLFWKWCKLKNITKRFSQLWWWLPKLLWLLNTLQTFKC